MKIYKQLLTSVAGFALLVCSATAKATDEGIDNEFASKISSGENVVLFKIHDIEPIKSESGVITECEFGMTFYNRSPKSVDAATISLSWIDEGITNVIELEENLNIDDDKAVSSNSVSSLKQRVSMPKTENFVSADLATSITLPQIKPFRQVSLKSKIKSDRCFLLMENVDFSFSTCNVTEPTSTSTSTKRLTATRKTESSGCDTLFRFVSPQDPEYYREFQKVAFNDEQQRKDEARKKEINEMETCQENKACIDNCM